MPRRAALLLSFMLVASGGEHALAQMQLPGAVAPTPQGATAPGRTTTPRAPGDGSNPLAPRTVSGPPLRRWEDGLPGRTLRFLGQHGSLVITRSGTGPQASYSVVATGIVGRRGNDIRNICTPSLNGGQPVPLTAQGRPAGLARFEAAFPGCTITLDLMADAAFVAAPGGACTFDDCVVDPTGLWGPNDREITSDREIERARALRSASSTMPAASSRPGCAPRRKGASSCRSKPASRRTASALPKLRHLRHRPGLLRAEVHGG